MANTVQNAALAKPVAVFLRGLTVRLSWAKAGPDGDLNPAYGEAEGQGFKDFEVGRALADVPPLFADVPELASFWSKGWEHAYVRHSPEFL